MLKTASTITDKHWHYHSSKQPTTDIQTTKNQTIDPRGNNSGQFP